MVAKGDPCGSSLLFRLCHRSLEIHQRLDGRRIHTITHRQIIGNVIPKEDHCPHVCERGTTAGVDEICVHAFEHKCFTGQVGTQAVARMVRRSAQEESHRMRVKHFLRMHRPGKGIVVGFGEELEIRAGFGDLVDLSLPAAGNGSQQTRAPR